MGEKIIVLTGPSGSGKTTIAKILTEIMPRLCFFISLITRSPRYDEIPGKDYYFTDVEDFKRRITNNEFIEWEEVYEGKFYGTLYSELKRIWFCQKYPLRVVDIRGAKSLKEKFNEKVLTIFIKPPSFKVLEKRLIRRNSDKPEDIQERVEVAKGEMKFCNDFDKSIINDDLEKSVLEINKIINEFISS